jgi:hypothetical protein
VSVSLYFYVSILSLESRFLGRYNRMLKEHRMLCIKSLLTSVQLDALRVPLKKAG